MYYTLKHLEYGILNNIKSNLSLKKIKNEIINYKGTDWNQYIDTRNYGNSYNKVKISFNPNNEYFDMYLITWLNNKKSNIHDHSTNGCLLYLLEGNLTEYIYNECLEIVDKQIIPCNAATFIDNKIGYHSIKNNRKISVSLHIYSPKDYETKYFIQ